jgi:hypothetical protein
MDEPWGIRVYDLDKIFTVRQKTKGSFGNIF